MGMFGDKKQILLTVVVYVTGTWVALGLGVILAWRLTSQVQPALVVAGTAAILIPALGIGIYYAGLKIVNKSIETVRKAIDGLAQGELGVTLDVDSDDELALLGAGVNDLSANLQELMLHIWQQTARSQRYLSGIESELKTSGERSIDRDEIHSHLRDAMEALSDLRQLVTAYAFYDVRLEDEKPVATNTEGNEKLN